MAKLHVAEGTAAEAVCSMIAALCDDDYRVVIDYGDTLTSDDGELYAAYSVKVIDTDDSVVAAASAHYLSDALADAYMSTPERQESGATNE